jgi:hypothetical protein
VLLRAAEPLAGLALMPHFGFTVEHVVATARSLA